MRGFTRLANGKKVFINHDIDTIRDYIDENTQSRYKFINVNIYQENIFHTKMMLKSLDLNTYLFGKTKDELDETLQDEYLKTLNREMKEI